LRRRHDPIAHDLRFFLAPSAPAAVLAVLALTASAAWADGLDSLQNFIQHARSGRADFTQTVTAPPRDGKPGRAKTSSGTFEFQRPGKFRFDYQKPFVQTIVADGQTLWLYDADLNQVTERAQAQVLGQTPAALIAEATDARCRPTSPSLPSPRAAAVGQGRAQDQGRTAAAGAVGFDGEQLAALEILDNFGQRSVLRFGPMQLNPQLPAGAFQFKPPAGRTCSGSKASPPRGDPVRQQGADAGLAGARIQLQVPRRLAQGARGVARIQRLRTVLLAQFLAIGAPHQRGVQ
jgi:outer membrane lipoprotein carrier protein